MTHTHTPGSGCVSSEETWPTDRNGTERNGIPRNFDFDFGTEPKTVTPISSKYSVVRTLVIQVSLAWRVSTQSVKINQIWAVYGERRDRRFIADQSTLQCALGVYTCHTVSPGGARATGICFSFLRRYAGIPS